jgi:hypothetical protein
VNRFLYSDSTRGALQVLSRHSGVVDSTNHSLPGGDNGVWINADPIQGCVVVNIGESKLLELNLMSFFDNTRCQCGRSGRMAYIAAHCIKLSTKSHAIGMESSLRISN